MKKIKDLNLKAEDLKTKVSTYCSDHTLETPVYGDGQAGKIKEWLQSYGDTTKEILRLRLAIQRTNLATTVTMELGGKQVTKCIGEWIHRRRDLAKMDKSVWDSIGDRGLKEGIITTSTGEKKEVKIRRYYDPNERDKMVELYRSEPSIIDSTLEVTNAVTELQEAG